MSSAPVISVRLPASKSISNRWLVLQRLSNSQLVLDGLSTSTDTTSLQRLLCQEGHDYEAGEGGTTFRFLAAALAVLPGQHQLMAGKRMSERPVRELVDALRQLGVEVIYSETDGFAPLTIRGGMIKGGQVVVDSDRSSQFASALLLIAPFLPEGLEVRTKGKVVSRSYIDMTLSILSRAGIKWEESGGAFRVYPGEPSAQRINIEPDWSSAAFFYQLCALRPHVKVHLPGLVFSGLQGDEAAARLFKPLGVTTTVSTDGILITGRESPLMQEALLFDLTDFPDLAPALVMACYGRRQRAVFTGIGHLRHKESDRIDMLVGIIDATGGNALVCDDRLELQSFPAAFIPVTVDPRNDHRIAMTMTVFSSTGCSVVLNDSSVVSKSFPDFRSAMAPFGLPVTFL